MLKKTRFIFSINPGRSGSHYLSKLFSHGYNCRSFHEARPVGNEEAMRRFLNGDGAEIKEIAKIKAEIIRKSDAGDTTYVETNHCFIKGFGWYISQFLEVPDEQIGVIVLRRDKEDFAHSTHRIGCRPLNSVGRNWLITPDLSNRITSPPSRFGLSAKATYRLFKLLNYPFSGKEPFLSLRKMLGTRAPSGEFPIREASSKEGRRETNNPGGAKTRRVAPTRSITDFIKQYEIDSIKWSYDETYAMADLYEKKFPLLKYYHVDITDLNSFEKVIEMMNFFGISWKESMRESIDIATNKNTKTRI